MDWGKKAFRGIIKFVDCRLQKIKKKDFEILKFVDFHFKFVDFACRDSTVKCSFEVNLLQVWIIVVHYQLVVILIII